jgi:hypothetical protein
VPIAPRPPAKPQPSVQPTPSAATPPADNPILCAAPKTSWAKVSGGSDVAAMNQVIAQIPKTSCPNLLNQAQAIRAAVATAPPNPANRALAGAWRGTYTYDNNPTAAPGDFTFDLKVSGNTVSGRITEPNTFGTAGVPFLYANISGTIDGDAISFSKTYDGTGGQTHTVYYNGVIDRAAHTVSGTWFIPAAAAPAKGAANSSAPGASTGRFTMSLSQ